MRITEDHIKSIIFGVAVGDALGVPVEFSSRERMVDNPLTDMIGFGTYNLPKGTWSDDSTMTFCLAETLLDDEFDLKKLANRFINWVDWGYWTPYGELFDIGNTTKKSIDTLRTIDNPEKAGGSHESDNGNGSLMRILPLILDIGELPISLTYNKVKSVSSLTHSHERSVNACFYYLTFARYIILGHSKESSYQLTNATVINEFKERRITDKEFYEFKNILDGDLHNLPISKIRGSGYVIHSLEASLWSLLNANSYEEAVLKAVNLGEDTDTTAAITGGISALCFGYNSIPVGWVESLAKKEEIERLVKRLISKYTLKIKLKDVPEIGDINGASNFVHKFSGYRTTFEETSKSVFETKNKLQSKEFEKLKVEDLAESLFFYFRALRHGEGQPDIDYVNEHISLIRTKLLSHEE
jgi:ADP-ribosyl-[dinitrogen reductase] hydrolase